MFSLFVFLYEHQSVTDIFFQKVKHAFLNPYCESHIRFGFNESSTKATAFACNVHSDWKTLLILFKYAQSADDVWI